MLYPQTVPGSEPVSSGPAGGAPLLDEGTLSGDGRSWRVKVYKAAAEAVVFLPREPRGFTGEDVADWAQEAEARATLAARSGRLFAEALPGEAETRAAEDIDQAEEERRRENRARAARRARTRVRRYCKANRLDKLLTLTLAEGTAEREAVISLVNGFFRAWRAARGGRRLPYVWVLETHESGNLHVHLAIGVVVPMRCERCDPHDVGKGLHKRDVRSGEPCIRCTWGRGFVDARRLGARKAKGEKGAVGTVTRYVTKYVGKSVEGVEAGAKSYEVGRGFTEVAVEGEVAGTADQVVGEVAAVFFGGKRPAFVWSSEEVDDWLGPPVRVVFWT